jgi:leucyl-tRNA synthetase
MVSDYNPKEIEAKWQKKWLDEKVFAARDDSPKPKYYQLETFPYPSGAGLHVGHPKGYIAEDIHARYMRMGGDAGQPGGVGKPRDVLYTMGWDAFGLPTENYALKVGKTPQEVTRENTDNFRRQVRMFGLSYDWDREINTSSPDYYKWTQWLFIQLFKKGLAYRAAAKVNWCPKDQTVLANEQVVNGRCERCGTEIEERDMEQWFVRITQYADRLLSGLQGLDWPSATVRRQEDWIGRSEGSLIKFSLKDAGQIENNFIEVFTTRADTLFGGTYLVLAPEHPFLNQLQSRIQNWEEVEKYIEAASHKTELMRKTDEKEKTGVELKGIVVENPANKKDMSVWVADFVLGSYGTGAVFADAHDERDFAFAKKYGIPLTPTVRPADGRDDIKIKNLEECFSDYGILFNSGPFDGMDSETAKWKITEAVHGTRKTQYRIRDWSISRQRYWGVPIPMIHCEKDGIVSVPEADLPVILPEMKDFQPKGMPPLAASPEFINVTCPECGGAAKRDPETLDTFVDSSWYYLRYTDPHNTAVIFDKGKAKQWLPVQLYVIGAEHTVLHLLYARFIAKFLHDEGWLDFEEPFLKLRHQGLIRGADGQKMSKSKGNVVNPDEIVGEFGADTVRMYEMFMGPFEDGAPWDPKSILGVERFLRRIWKYMEAGSAQVAGAREEVMARALLHKTIKKVGEDITGFKFNTAISALMILLNELEKTPGGLAAEDRKAFLKILHPFAPHLTQELWSRVHATSGESADAAGGRATTTYLDFELWPAYDAALIKEEKIKLILQVNGRLRDSIEVDAAITEVQAKELALANPKVMQAMAAAAVAAGAGPDAGSHEPKKIIYVDKKLVNIVM